MPRSYPTEFRRKVPDLVEAGRPVAEIAGELGVTGQTIYNWPKQDLVAHGLRPGVTTAESAELAAARGRIRELETQLAATRRAFDLLKERTNPRGASRSSPRSYAAAISWRSPAGWSVCRCRATTAGVLGVDRVTLHPGLLRLFGRQ